jgi:hypothetical protein
MDSSLNKRAVFFLFLILLAIQGVALYVMGQPLTSESGVVELWHGIVKSPENSQQISDWYTYSHIIHGFLFYLVFSLLFPKLHPAIRLLFALGLEVAWEITENTPWLINHYRQQALAMGYEGDTILNSISDSLAMVIGFVIAWRVPVVITILVALALEFGVAYSIHDNLFLNVLNLIHQFDLIREWQSGS